MALKIFISSTYTDLIIYRNLVANELRKLGHNVVQFEPVGNQDEEPTEAALTELGKCDVVIGIYAHQYGFIPEKNDFSIIEQEYYHAKGKQKPIYGFIVHEDYPWPPKMIERDHPRIKKLNEFLATIKREIFVDYFTTPESLASLVAVTIRKYISEQSNEEIYDEDIQDINTRPRSSLPSLHPFFGREKELKIVADTLSPKIRSWGVLIDGPGGIGKTALAIKAAQEASDVLFDRKIFLTAKTHELTPSGTKELFEYARINYLAMLNELALELGEDSITKLPEEDRASFLRRALTKQRVLIIFDNLETLDDKEVSKLYQFLSLLPEGNKAIVTSRRRSDVDVRTIRLNSLNSSEVKELIASLTENSHLLRVATQDEQALLNLHTGGNPLLIKWVIGQLGREGGNLRTVRDAIEFMEQANKNNDPLEFIFGDLIKTLSRLEKLVLASLTHVSFASSSNIRCISHMSDELPKRTLEYVFDELSIRSILNADKKSLAYFLPAVTAGYIRSKMPDEVSITGRRLMNYVYMTAAKYNKQKGDMGIKMLDDEWPAILAALPYFFKDRNEDLQDLCELLESFLKSSGRWDEWLWLLQNAEKKARESEDYYSAGMRAYETGLIYSYRGEAKQVLEKAASTKSYWKLTRTNKHSKEMSRVSYIYGIGFKLENNYEISIRYLKDANKSLKTSRNESNFMALVLYSLAEAQMEYGILEDAEKNLTEALRIANKNNDSEGIVIYKGSLADLALSQRDWVRAEELGLESLKLADQYGQQEEIARNNYRIALSLVKQNYPKRAFSYARKSVAIYTQLRHQYLKEAQDLFRRIKGETKKINS